MSGPRRSACGPGSRAWRSRSDRPSAAPWWSTSAGSRSSSSTCRSGIIAFVVATRTVKESVSEEERQLDIPGLVLGTAALFSLTYALIEANQLGWSDPLIVSTLVAARSSSWRSCTGSSTTRTR